MERSVAALNRIRSILLAAMALFCVLTLSGCIAKTVDELYALPRHSDEVRGDNDGERHSAD